MKKKLKKAPVVVKHKTKPRPKPAPAKAEVHKSQPKRKVAKMSKPPKDRDQDYIDDEPIPGPDQGEQSPEREQHPIEATLTTIDEAMRQSQGGEPGSGIYALLANVAAQMGVKITPPAAKPAKVKE
jgi:hypothetical protein